MAYSVPAAAQGILNMKNFFKIAGTLSRRLCAVTIAAVIGFSMAACSGGGSGGTFTVTGIPKEYNGKYAYLFAFSEGGTLLMGYQDKSTKGFTLPRISNGSVAIPLWKLGITRYSGDESVIVGVVISDSEVLDAINPVKNAIGSEATFVKGSATKDWSEMMRYQ